MLNGSTCQENEKVLELNWIVVSTETKSIVKENFAFTTYKTWKPTEQNLQDLQIMTDLATFEKSAKFLQENYN